MSQSAFIEGCDPAAALGVELTLDVNGRVHRCSADIQMTLLDALR